MEYSNYVASTLSVSLGKIFPVIFTIACGYFVFIKLPFFIFLKVLKDSQPRMQDISPQFQNWNPNENVFKLDDYQTPERKKKLAQEALARERDRIRMNHHFKFSHEEKKKKEEPKQERKEERKEEKREEKKEEKKTSPAPKLSSAEIIFELKPGSVFTKSELKKKYHELLKTSHPDKVSLDQKPMAEMKTKEINSAYQKLKAKAA